MAWARREKRDSDCLLAAGILDVLGQTMPLAERVASATDVALGLANRVRRVQFEMQTCKNNVSAEMKVKRVKLNLRMLTCLVRLASVEFLT